MVFFTADLHFDHSAILKHSNRPFSSIEEMNQSLIDNWNSRVSAKDLVYVIGDFAWKRADYFLSQLNGNIVFILGNHDKALLQGKQSRKQIVKSHIHSITIKEKELLSSVEDIDDLYPLKDKQHIVLCHYAMRSWNRSHYGSYHLFGHTHGGEPYGKSFDVGVDCHNYFPISYIEMKRIMNTLNEKPKTRKI